MFLAVFMRQWISTKSGPLECGSILTTYLALRSDTGRLMSSEAKKISPKLPLPVLWGNHRERERRADEERKRYCKSVLKLVCNRGSRHTHGEHDGVDGWMEWNE